MTTVEFVSYLQGLGLKLWADGDRLRCRGPAEALTAELQSEMRRQKAEILAYLRAADGGAPAEEPPLQRVSRDGSLPLSFAQQRLWLLDQLEPGSIAYNMPAVFRLTGPLNVAALEQSLGEIIRRHEGLRTTFATVNGQPVQVIARAEPITLSVVDLQKLPQTEREAEARRLASEEVQRPFDLTRGPLFRASLLRLGEEDHVFSVTMHHIVSDWWSIGVFVQELSTLYQAFRKGHPSPLAELPVQYADFASWQRQWLKGEELEKQIAYWKRQLSGSPPVLELPTDRLRPPVQAHRGARQFVVLPRTLTAALKGLSQQEEVTLFMTLLAAFKTLLYRYTGQEDIVVGAPIAGRTRSEIEGLIGFFLNTLVLRTDLSGNPTFRELMARVREVGLAAYAHQDLPFEKLLEELQPERDLSRTPLFQVFFNMLNVAENDIQLSGLQVENFSTPELGAKFDLTMYVRERDGSIQLTLVYNSNLYEQDRMVEMLDQFKLLLGQIVENPEERIARFSLITRKAEALLPNPLQELDSNWEGAVHTQFSQQARRVPERLAVVDRQGAWSYRDIDLRSSQLANYLRAHDIQSQDIVAIYGYRSASLVCAVLGILKAGAAFVILDPAYPASRLVDCLRLARPRGWIQIEQAATPPAPLKEFVATLSCRCHVGGPEHSTVAAGELLRDYSVDDPKVTVGPDDLACVAFTSGSTGGPKGILGRHGPLSHFLPWMRQTFGLLDTDRYSMISGLSHDPLQRDIFTPLQLGATLCIPDPEDIGTPGRLGEWMRREEISIANLTPALGQLLTEATPGPKAARCEIPSLRCVFFVGDILTQRDVSRLRVLAPRVTIVNLYGATETQRAVGYFVLPNGSEDLHGQGPTKGQSRETVPLGRGMKDVQLLVINRSGQLAGIGELGEIQIRSPHLARGYLGDDELTRERFIINPFTKVFGDRLYRTGDLGRYLPDGQVEFAGRSDNQVKIRGFRIELGEVEATLGRHPSVQECVILTREDMPGGKRLVAYVVAHQGPAPSTGELHSFLKQKLPDYMIPPVFVLLDALPLTPNGKVDRRALPVPDRTRPELEGAFLAPRTLVEEELARIWREVLKIEQVGIHDNFFHLGGHSLLATQVMSRLRGVFQVELPLRSLFETPTVAGLALAIVQSQVDEETARVLAELESLPEEEAQKLLASESR